MKAFNRNILIIDCDSKVHEYVKEHLCGFNSTDALIVKNKLNYIEYSITSAYSGEEGLKLIDQAQSEGNPYSLVFIDLNIGNKNTYGVDVLLKSWEKHPHIEFVLWTAKKNFDWDDEVHRIGHSDKLLFMRKPVHRNVLKQIALSKTEKWNIKRETEEMIVNLELKVIERGKLLEEQRAKSIYASKMASLGEIAAGLAHELNNPLTVLQMSTQLINKKLSKILSEEDKKLLSYVDKISETGNRIGKIVSGLKGLLKEKSMDMQQLHSLDKIMKSVLNLTTQKFQFKKIQIDYTGDESIYISCYASEIAQVVLNLLTNSYDVLYDYDGNRNISIEIKNLGDFVNIYFKDTGPGLVIDEKEKVFQPFFTTKDVGKGTGLGLPISKNIIESHGGTIEVLSSFKGEGFQVVITLPSASSDKIKLAS